MSIKIKTNRLFLLVIIGVVISNSPASRTTDNDKPNLMYSDNFSYTVSDSILL